MILHALVTLLRIGFGGANARSSTPCPAFVIETGFGAQSMGSLGQRLGSCVARDQEEAVSQGSLRDCTIKTVHSHHASSLIPCQICAGEEQYFPVSF